VQIKVNAPPVVDAGADVAVPWGIPIDLGGAAADPDGDVSKATVTWSFGDGETASTLQAAHVYAEPGTYTATLTVADQDGGVSSDTALVTVGPRVSSLAVTAAPALDSAKATVTATLADLTDPTSARLKGHAVQFAAGGATCTTATTADGEAACTLPAAVLALGPGMLTARLDGDSLYAGSLEKAPVLVYAMPAGGAFAVGDESARGDVVFWDPSWWRLNPLSGGRAPASFKGFATTPIDGGWLAPPGFETGPAVVPEWMGVLVANQVAKNGAAIVVTTSRMIVVHVDAYDENAGRGTVVTPTN
jgi:hypothetical protein